MGSENGPCPPLSFLNFSHLVIFASFSSSATEYLTLMNDWLSFDVIFVALNSVLPSSDCSGLKAPPPLPLND
jgi:hypothetical protein